MDSCSAQYEAGNKERSRELLAGQENVVIKILDNDITFDETVPYGEDILFSIEAYGKAERICYLPQSSTADP